MIRAFISLHPPEPIIAALARRQRRLQRELTASSLRWTDPTQNHLTLRFLGDIEEASQTELALALERACRPRAPLTLRLGQMGCFPGPGRPRVLWVGVEGQVESLRELQRAITAETAAWGETEDRPFHPHLTLARVRQPTEKLGLAMQEVIALQDDVPEPVIDWPVNRVDLMRSELTPQGSRYTCLAGATLGG